MSPTQVLKEEHKIIKEVLQSMKKEAANIKETGDVNTSKIDNFIKFSREFTDGAHHAKEEHLLFPKMGERGFSGDSGPVAVMLMEHIEGRRFIGLIEENIERIKNGDEAGKDQLVQAILNYSDLLNNHINKEDNILFKMADNVLDKNSQDELKIEFDKVDHDGDAEERYNSLINIAHNITGK